MIRTHLWIIVSDDVWVGGEGDPPLVFKTRKQAKIALDAYLMKAHIEKVELVFVDGRY